MRHVFSYFLFDWSASIRRPSIIVILILIAVSTLSAGSSPISVLLQQNQRPELVLQTGHSLGVNCISFAPDGSWLASAGADNSVIVWQTSSSKQLRALNGHNGYVRSVVISRDGRWIASGSNDRTVKLWEAASGHEVFNLVGHNGPVVSLAISSDNRWLASGSVDKTIKIWDLKTGKEIRTLDKHTAPLSAMAFSRSSSFFVSAADHDVIVWNTKNWEAKQTFSRSTTPISTLAITNDETSIASASTDGTVLFWQLGAERERFAFKHNLSSALTLGFTADSLIAIHSDRGIDTWDLNKGDLRQSVSGDANREQLSFAALSLDSSIFAATNGSRTFQTQRVATGEVVASFESHATAVNSLAFSADGRWFAAASNDSSIRLWQVATGRELPALKGHAGYVTTVAFSPDSSLLASASRSGEVKIWDVDSARLSFSLPSHTNGVDCVAFSANGKLLAVVGMNPKVEVWNLEKKQVQVLTGHVQEVTSAVFAKADTLLITAGRDKTLRIWDVNTGAATKSFQAMSEINGIALSTTGDLLATANADHTIRLVDLNNGVVKQTLTGHNAEVLSVNFNPSGAFLASASADHTALVWDLQSNSTSSELKGNIDTITSVAFSKNSDWVFTGSEDGSILLWQASSGRLKATLVSIPNSDNWLVATPDGLFDGSPEAWNLMLWRFEQDTFKVVPVEAYFNEFYYPGLLAEILAGQDPKALEDIAQKDRRQPLVALKATGDSAARNIDIDVTINAAAPDKTHAFNSGVRDLRLFRNGLLVKTWTGDVLRDGKETIIQARVPIVAGENRFTAYAFNSDNVKSTDANLFVNGPENLKRQGTAYLLMIGVEQYENQEYNLRYAAADVDEMEAQLKAQQEKLGRYNPVVTIPLKNREATKANVLLALQRLAGSNTTPLPAQAPAVLARIKPAQPEDAVLVYFSGHGVSAANHFYLIPHDLGYNGPRNKLDASGLEKILAHGISDAELETALQPLDANQLLLVIDACYSGQAIESTEKRRGPMNTKGLAQLAYEKGIYILTASQNIEVAFEAEAFKHSYLAYALLEEGLKEGAADANHDGNIFLREWFDYANSRVPQLRRLRFKRKELVEEEADEQKVQRPRVFYTREEGANTFLIGRATAN